MIFQAVLSVSLQKGKWMQAPGYAFTQTSQLSSLSITDSF